VVENKLLLAQCYNTTSLYDFMYGDLREYREFLLEKYPSMGSWFPKYVFDREPVWKERFSVKLNKGGVNTAGQYIAANLSTPTRVINEPANPELLLEELQKDNYTHVGLGILVDGYGDYIRCAQAIRDHYPDITIVAGNVGALFPGTEKYADLVCEGDGVDFLRRLLGESTDDPHRLALIPSQYTLSLFGMEFPSDLVQLVTKIGCPNTCDFCVTNKLFGGKFTGSMFTPEQVHEAIVELRHKRNRDFKIGFAEPTAIESKEWWYRLFELFEGDDGDYPVLMSTTAASLQNFDLDRLKNSAMRIETINLGVESFSTEYGKNKNTDMTRLVRSLYDHGIGVYATFIIGFDHQTKESIWDEIRQLVGLDASAFSVINLKPLPRTPIWKAMEDQHRFIDVPYDFFYVHGFQTYTHPHIRPGFEDMLPLLVDINSFIEKERGMQGLDLIGALSNIAHEREAIVRQIKTYKAIGKLLFPSWKSNLQPSQVQIDRYLAKIDNNARAPLAMKLLMKSPAIRRVVNSIMNRRAMPLGGTEAQPRRETPVSSILVSEEGQ